MRDLFSSAAASHSFAGRAVREVSKHNLAVLDRLSDAIKPVHKEIMQRGKLPRERVQPSFDAIRRHLTGCPNVVALECAVYAPSQHRLSSREGRSMRLIMLTSDPDANADERVDFLAFVMLARHEITVRVEMLDLSVSAHVLARFMQRRQKGLLNFFGGIMSPLKTASVLVSSALVHPSGRIALPHEDGLLLGEVILYDEPDENGRLPFVRTYDRAGRRTTPAESSARADGTRIMAHIRTFVDTDSLSPVKEALRDRLLAWERRARAQRDEACEMGPHLMVFVTDCLGTMVEPPPPSEFRCVWLTPHTEPLIPQPCGEQVTLSVVVPKALREPDAA